MESNKREDDSSCSEKIAIKSEKIRILTTGSAESNDETVNFYKKELKARKSEWRVKKKMDNKKAKQDRSVDILMWFGPELGILIES